MSPDQRVSRLMLSLRASSRQKTIRRPGWPRSSTTLTAAFCSAIRDKKTKEDDRDYSGSINIEGREYWLNGWMKTSGAGKKFLSLSVKPKNAPA